MAADWERLLERWTREGLIETATANLIRAYETGQAKDRGLKWPILLAIVFGGLLLAAGILLFVAAHWDRLSQVERFTLILALVAITHIGGAIAAPRFDILSTAMHAVGTICLGAGIFLAGQIFHLQEHWPGGVMLWALGAWAAWVLLRDWPQAALAAILTPVWLWSEWSVATHGWKGSDLVQAAGSLSLAISYMTAVQPGKDNPVRKALLWLGGLTLIPLTVWLVLSGGLANGYQHPMPWDYYSLGWAAAFLLPLGLACWLRGRHAWLNLVAAVWVSALSATRFRFHEHSAVWDLASYALCAMGSIGLIAWGLKEGRKERVNIGIAGFALTILFFYFSTVMDKLGRSASLIGLGLMFLLGGWFLEKTRRRLIYKIGKGAA
jgi:uncharacterized membrane protein